MSARHKRGTERYIKTGVRHLRPRTGESERLRSLAGFRVLDTGPEPEFDAVAALAARIGGADGAVVTFVAEDREFVKAAVGLELPDVPRASSLGERVVSRGGPVVVEDARRDPQAASCAWVALEPGVCFYAGVPLTVGGLTVGTLALLGREPRAAGDELLASLSDAAAVLVPHLERRREEAMAQNLITVVDREGYIQRISTAFEPLFGWRQEEVAGRHALEFVHPDDLASAEALLRAVAEGAPPKSFECRYVGKDGRYRWVLWNFDLAPDGQRLYCAGKEITDRKAKEAALRESEARYRLLAENATDMIIGHDLEGRLRYVSRAGQALTGFDPDELAGRSAYDMIHPDDEARARRAHKVLLEGGPPQRVVMRLQRRDGGWVWVETVARVVRDQDSRPIGIQSSTRDITETKQAVEALEAAREHFRRAFDDAPIGMGIVSRDGRCLRVNAALCEFLAYTEDELLGVVDPLGLIHPDDRGGEERGLRELLRGERRTFAIERRLRRKDGRDVWARVTTSVMREEPHAEAALLTHVEDTTEAERANRAKSEFLSRMSHELRTPLNSVLGFAQLLEGEELPPAQRESVGRILRGGYHLLNLVNDVLDISAIESGRLPIPTEAVPACSVALECIDLLRPLADERSIDVACECTAQKTAVEANPQRLKQVLLNLIANAIKYSPPGSRVRVDVRLAGDGRARIDVTDTGPGIPADQLERAFIPFERLGAGRDVEGTGLGLPLSRNLAHAMGGSLTAQSSPDGSTFTVELPLAAAEADDEPDTADARDGAAATNGNGHCRRLLYIEDNASNVALVERLVRRRDDLELHAASRGDAGIELARRLRPDVVLLDLHLPDTTGDEVLAQLRDDPATRGVPVIVISADATQEHARRLRSAGAAAYMTKPLDLGRFAAVIDAALEG